MIVKYALTLQNLRSNGATWRDSMPCGPCGLVPKLPARQQYHQVLKGAGHASRHGRAHFGRLVNAADMGEKLPRILALVFDTPN